MTEKQKILIVDDDENIAELISLYLTKECYETVIAYDGDSALTEFAAVKPQMILLDIMLPGRDGYSVLSEIRKTSDVPVILLSAKGEVFDRVLGLELGADDYMVKPFDSKELVARVKAILRRAAKSAMQEPAETVTYEGLSVNLTNYEATYLGKRLEMPPKELELLFFLAKNPNHVFTRDQLLERIWGFDYVGDTRTVDVHIKRIREKIPGTASWKIDTVWGVGYRFEVTEK